MDFRKLLLLAFILGFVGIALGQDTGLNLYDSDIDLNQNNITSPGQITNFFDQSKCGSDEAVKTVYPNGSYACNQLSTTTEAENLSETLAAGNVANQTIEFDSSTGIQIGDSSTSTSSSDSIAIGDFAETRSGQSIAIGLDTVGSGGFGATAVGDGSKAGNQGTVALGYNSKSQSEGSIAIGYYAGSGSTEGKYAVILGGDPQADPKSGSVATGDYSMALGPNASATSNGAVAVGRSAIAPNSYEATFGNLDNDQLDVNVTGNLTVHGEEGISMPNGISIGESSVSSSNDIAIGDSSISGSGGSKTAIGNTVSVSAPGGIAIGGYDVESSADDAISIGTKSASDDTHSVVIGKNAGLYSDEGKYSVAIGPSTGEVPTGAESTGKYALSLGTEAKSRAESAVAIGYEAKSVNPYEATFGNLDNDQLDVNVTGNLTVHGSNLTFANDATIDSFFDQDKCGDSEAIKTIYPNGSYACNAISSTTGTESLFETLQSGDFTNGENIILNGSSQINYDSGGIKIGKGSEANTRGIAIGIDSNAVSRDSSVFGTNLDNSTAVGANASARGWKAAAYGSDSNAFAYRSIALGHSATALTDYGQAVGFNSFSDGTDATAIGPSTRASANYATALGPLTKANASGAISIGRDTLSGSPGSVTIGSRASSIDGDFQSVIGRGASGRGREVVAVGRDAFANGLQAVSIGYLSETNDSYSTALGSSTFAQNTTSTAVGAGSESRAVSATALGADAIAEASGSIAIGSDALAQNSDEATFGNLDNDQLDVNVTGNLTVHQDATVQDLTVEGSCTGCGGGSSSGLPTILSNNNTAGSNNLDMFGQNITDSTKGNVTVGQDLNVNGDIYVTGADLAEIYSSHQDLEKGELVMLSDREEVERTEDENSDPVGVVSTNPGSVLNADENGHPIALEGKVPVKVNERVEQGDHIVPSGTPGVATSCSTSDVSESLSSNSTNSEIVEAVKQVEDSQECLKDSIGTAMETGTGNVKVKLE